MNNNLPNYIPAYINSSKIEQAQNILQSILKYTNTDIYIINPDGTSLKLMPGVKIMSLETISLSKD